MKKEQQFHLSPLKSLLKNGKVNFISVDTSINNCGIFAGVFGSTINVTTLRRDHRLIIKSLDIISSVGSLINDMSMKDRISYVGNKVCSLIDKYSCNLVLIEEPERSIVYGSKRNINYVLKRADSISIVRSIVYFIIGSLYDKTIRDRGKFFVIPVTPSSWQIKKKGFDSKEVSIDLLNSRLKERVASIDKQKKKIKIELNELSVVNSKAGTSDHMSDAFNMAINLFLKNI
jgi:hypothetical protein